MYVYYVSSNTLNIHIISYVHKCIWKNTNTSHVQSTWYEVYASSKCIKQEYSICACEWKIIHYTMVLGAPTCDRMHFRVYCVWIGLSKFYIIITITCVMHISFASWYTNVERFQACSFVRIRMRLISAKRILRANCNLAHQTIAYIHRWADRTHIHT